MRNAPVVDVDSVHARLVRRFGPEVAEWCAGLPTLAGDLAGRWGLRLGQAWPTGGTSVVLPCESDDGELLVLKLTPDLKIASEEATALNAWMARRHVVTLHDADLDRGALLLERVLPGHGGGGEQAVQQRIDWLAGRVDGLDPDRTWGWCQALAVVLAVILPSSGDPAGEEMLAMA